MRYYPTLATFLLSLFVVVFQLSLFLVAGVSILSLKLQTVIAEQTCPLPAAPTVINNQITITPDNVDGVVNCASLDIIIGSTGEVVIDRNITLNGSTNGDWGVTLLVNNLTIQNGGKINANGKK